MITKLLSQIGDMPNASRCPFEKNHRQIFHGPHPFRDWPIAHNRTIESPEGSILIRERNHRKTSFVSELDLAGVTGLPVPAPRSVRDYEYL
jgi:hypothetical protein